MNSTQKVRYPDPVSDGLFNIMSQIATGKQFPADKITGLRQRGLVTQSGKLTPVGKQMLQLRSDLARSHERVAELQRARFNAANVGLKKI